MRKLPNIEDIVEELKTSKISEVAEKTGYTVQNLYYMIKNKPDIKLSTYLKLIKHFNMI